MLESHGRTFKPVDAHKTIRQLFDSAVHYGITTRDSCDCGTVVGSHSPCEDDEPTPEEQHRDRYKLIRKYKRKGWNAARIEELLRQREYVTEHKTQQQSHDDAEGAALWVRILHALVEVSATRRVWLLLHEYQGGLETEAIQLRRRASAHCKDITPEFVMSVEEDVLYELHA